MPNATDLISLAVTRADLNLTLFALNAQRTAAVDRVRQADRQITAARADKTVDRAELSSLMTVRNEYRENAQMFADLIATLSR